MKKEEELPLGLILCADKSDEHVELLMLSEKRIKVTCYLTALPSKELLLKHLHRVIEIASKNEKLEANSFSIVDIEYSKEKKF